MIANLNTRRHGEIIIIEAGDHLDPGRCATGLREKISEVAEFGYRWILLDGVHVIVPPSHQPVVANVNFPVNDDLARRRVGMYLNVAGMSENFQIDGTAYVQGPVEGALWVRSQSHSGQQCGHRDRNRQPRG